ncbi:Solute carrier organic anion transporter family member 5A1 [Portunus trituberculatus]|uniref:Solute carrier organic anion transporter family member 5A1 n=1 Tax=Portunus trituberculatus TaxID=210409 RepID=A0A5B7FQQ3_PORTR|nr:Solute carrier organic anion transporter family member 5A1 [Portunus trituberculatus]
MDVCQVPRSPPYLLLYRYCLFLVYAYQWLICVAPFPPDAACRLWEESCGGRGSCWLYDIDTFRKTLHGIPAGLMALCLLTELVLIFLHKSIHLYGPAEKTREDS